MNSIDFRPLRGLASRHLQTILSAYLPPGSEPPSTQWLVELGGGDRLSCEVSIPPYWQATHETVALVHGLGGSHRSKYMVRLARKFYTRGHKVVRINLRGCGSGRGLSKFPYNAGTSHDVVMVLQALKEQAPYSSVHLIGFSLGGNVVLKAAGELGENASQYVDKFIAICAPYDLADAVERIGRRGHGLYHSYYLKKIVAQARYWTSQKVRTLYDFDDLITAPLWGYRGADEYYKASSCLQFLPKIKQSSHLLFSADDPFICCKALESQALPEQVHLWKTSHGGHMGFLGKTSNKRDFFWLDQQLFHWVGGPTHS